MSAAIKDVKIIPGCISCGACENICPEVFALEKCATVKKNVNFNKHEEKIREVADMCPVQVIKIVDTESSI
jgi:ferredoxin